MVNFGGVNSLEKIRKHMDLHHITKKKMAEMIGLRPSTFKDVLKRGSAISETWGKIDSFAATLEGDNSVINPTDSIKQFGNNNTEYGIEKIKYLLLLLELELRIFKNGTKEERDALRKAIDFGDVGYISSLLTMLGDEGRFKRWLTLTTNKFNFFNKRG